MPCLSILTLFNEAAEYNDLGSPTVTQSPVTLKSCTVYLCAIRESIVFQNVLNLKFQVSFKLTFCGLSCGSKNVGKAFIRLPQK